MIEFILPRKLVITSNLRLHPHAKAKQTKALRTLAKAKARGLIGPEPCRIIAYLSFPDKRRRDPNNWHPTTKALIDGMVDAGVFSDDNHTIIQGPDHRITTTKTQTGHVGIHLKTAPTENH